MIFLGAERWEHRSVDINIFHFSDEEKEEKGSKKQERNLHFLRSLWNTLKPIMNRLKATCFFILIIVFNENYKKYFNFAMMSILQSQLLKKYHS